VTASDLRLTYRPALDGLRGIAVIAVILYHLDAPWLPGGFLGVDAFFVLSGFLITSLLLREWEGNGRIDLPRFWTRRAKRLLPALIVVVPVTVALLPEVGGLPTSGDAVASLLYFANWRFVATAQSYFADLAVASPFRHMWSLAIEEHFYVLWPVVFLVLAKRRPTRPDGPLKWALVVVFLASAILMALLYSEADPSRSYFGTDTRIHQIAVGVLAGVVAWRGLPRFDKRVTMIVSTGALIGIVAMMIAVADSSDFYYRGGAVLLAVLVAVLILSMEGPLSGPPDSALSTAPLRWVGQLSYGMYLWHWPIIVLLAERSVFGAQRVVVALVATTALATLSFYLIEQPIRRGRLRDFRLTPSRTAAFSTVAIAAALGLVGLTATRAETPAWIAAADATPEVTVLPTDTSAPTVALIGDSVAASLSPGLARAAEAAGIGYASAAMRGCSVADGLQVRSDGSLLSYSERCDEQVPAAIVELLETNDPDVVIWYSGRESTVHYEVDGSVIAPGSPAHTAYIESELAEVRDLVVDSGAELRIVYPFPPANAACITRPDTEACEIVQERFADLSRLTAVLDGVAAGSPGVETLDLSRLVCRGDEGCDPHMDGVRVREDGNHFTDEMADLIAPEVLDAVLSSTSASP